jgi:hypothetical protein
VDDVEDEVAVEAEEDPTDDLSALIMEDEAAAEWFIRILELLEEDQEEQRHNEVEEELPPDRGVDDDEDPFEACDESDQRGDELPEDNVPTYPQEDARYFRHKKYVRNDKYELAWLLAGDITVPAIIDLFNYQAEK